MPHRVHCLPEQFIIYTNIVIKYKLGKLALNDKKMNEKIIDNKRLSKLGL